ncbi:12 TM domain-containing transmembrane protein [Acrasis kona]|uniref:12 TM domain-containing transmembrane protein n=1 Tax=Acrasis kona TaxID=1008807 RepID=A0AAW2YL86_9EUKA
MTSHDTQSMQSVTEEEEQVKQEPRYMHSVLQSIAGCILYSMDGFAISSTGSSLAMFKQNTNSENVKYVFTCRGFGYIFGAVATGSLFDALNEKVHHNSQISSTFLKTHCHSLWIIFSVILLCSSMALMPLVSSVWLLLLLHLVMGFATGVLDSASHILCIWAWKHKSNTSAQPVVVSGIWQRLKGVLNGGSNAQSSTLKAWYNCVHLCFGVGALLCPLIMNVFQPIIIDAETTSEQIASIYSRQRLTFMSLSILVASSLLFIPCYSLVRPVPKQKHQHHSSIKEQFIALVKEFWSRKGATCLLLSISMTLLVGAQLCFGGVINSFVTDHGLGTDETANYVASTYWSSITVMRFFCIPISYFVSSKVILILSVVETIICMIALGIWGKSSLTIVWIGTLLFGAGVSTQLPVALAYPASIGMELTGVMTTGVLVGGSIGDMTIPTLVSGIGTSYLFLVILILMVSVLIVYVMMMLSAEVRLNRRV